MSSLKEEELINILPKDGPTVQEVKKYLEKYNDEFIIIKCGGSILVDPKLFKIFIEDVVVLNKLGFNPIIVHGGGKRINSKLSEVNIKSNFINGLRVTDKDTINIVEDVLIEFNKEIVEALNELACKAKRITSKENSIITVVQENKDLGFVGTPTEINKEFLTETIKLNEVPVVATTGTSFNFIVSVKNSLLISVGVPTNPRSLFSCTTVIILFSFDVILFALQANSFKASTISLLNSINTSSTMLMVSLSVTLSPLIKLLLILTSESLLLILFPPP